MLNQHYNLESVYPFHTFEFHRLIPPFLIQYLQLMGGTPCSFGRFKFPLNKDVNPIIQYIDNYFNAGILYGQIVTLPSNWVYDSESKEDENFFIYPSEKLDEPSLLEDNPGFVDLIPQSDIELKNPRRFPFDYSELLASLQNNKLFIFSPTKLICMTMFKIFDSEKNEISLSELNRSACEFWNNTNKGESYCTPFDNNIHSGESTLTWYEMLNIVISNVNAIDSTFDYIYNILYNYDITILENKKILIGPLSDDIIHWTLPYADLFKYWQEQDYQLFKI